VLWGFKNIFPEEVPGPPLKRDIEFSIDLVPKALPTSKFPYRISAPELVEMKVKLKEMLDKGYITSSVSPWG